MSLFTLILLHVLPGVFQISLYLFLAPKLIRRGWPRTLVFIVSVLGSSLPFMLAVMFWTAQAETGQWSLEPVIGYREPMRWWQYLLLYVPLLGLAFGLLFATARLNQFLAKKVFGWLPPFLLPNWEPNTPVNPRLVLLALSLQVVVDGLAAPIVEELYFRGFLLPRLSALGIFAPLANSALFTIEHLWQPFNWALIFLLVLPEVYIVWWRQNIYIAMLLHCSANTIGALLALSSHLAERRAPAQTNTQ